MITSTHRQNRIEKTLTYPKLMFHPGEKVIVLFQSPEKGTVVGYNQDVRDEVIRQYPLGYATSAWIINAFEQLPPGYTVSIMQGDE